MKAPKQHNVDKYAWERYITTCDRVSGNARLIEAGKHYIHKNTNSWPYM